MKAIEEVWHYELPLWAIRFAWLYDTHHLVQFKFLQWDLGYCDDYTFLHYYRVEGLTGIEFEHNLWQRLNLRFTALERSGQTSSIYSASLRD